MQYVCQNDPKRTLTCQNAMKMNANKCWKRSQNKVEWMNINSPKLSPCLASSKCNELRMKRRCRHREYQASNKQLIKQNVGIHKLALILLDRSQPNCINLWNLTPYFYKVLVSKGTKNQGTCVSTFLSLARPYLVLFGFLST